MATFKTSVKFDYKLKLIFDNIKPRDKTNDEFLSELFDSCDNIVNKVEYYLDGSLRAHCLKLSPELVEKLDNLGDRLGLSRSEIIRRLIVARAKKLC